MAKHGAEKHNGEDIDFKVKILGSCNGDALLRQCMEAVAIRDDSPSMNDRAEWGIGKGRQKRKKANPGDRNDNGNSNDINNDSNSASNAAKADFTSDFTSVAVGFI